MAGVRAVLIALGVGAGVAAYATLWWHWPLTLGAVVGVVLGGLTLTGMVSVGTDPAAADAAWRAAAPDLMEEPSQPLEVPIDRTAPPADRADPAHPGDRADPAPDA